MTADVFHQSRSFFDTSNPVLDKSIMQVQTDPSSPQPSQMSSATGLILPDSATSTRIDNFPSDIYDVRPESHLVRFLRSLLGDAGVGQLRKKYLLARLQSALTSTHFFDLDRFYGALFNAQRTVDELLPVNPIIDTLTSDEWDDLHSKDSLYRERLLSLVKAIPMSGTVPGIQAAAEALTGVPCDVYETWALIDAYGQFGTGRSWTQVQSTYASWNATSGETWQSVFGAVQIGRTTEVNRSEFIVRPKKDYDNITDPAAQRRARAEDEHSLIRVLSLLKPAGTLLTVDFDGLAMHSSAPISAVSADSEFWEVTTKVLPRPGIRLGYRPLYPLSPLARNISMQDEHALPRPPFTQFQGETITYNSEIVSVQGYAESEDGSMVNERDHEVVTYFDGKEVAYTADKAIIDARQAIASRYANDGVLVAHPYAGEREAVTTSA